MWDYGLLYFYLFPYSFLYNLYCKKNNIICINNTSLRCLTPGMGTAWRSLSTASPSDAWSSDAEPKKTKLHAATFPLHNGKNGLLEYPSSYPIRVSGKHGN